MSEYLKFMQTGNVGFNRSQLGPITHQTGLKSVRIMSMGIPAHKFSTPPTINERGNAPRAPSTFTADFYCTQHQPKQLSAVVEEEKHKQAKEDQAFLKSLD